MVQNGKNWSFPNSKNVSKHSSFNCPFTRQKGRRRRFVGGAGRAAFRTECWTRRWPIVDGTMGSNWSFTGLPDPRLEAAFAVDHAYSEPSWVGADSATSLRLNSTHHLWLWADTYWGSVAGGRRENSAWVHNTLAITPTAAIPVPTFFARTEGASVASPLPFFSPPSANEFYWMVAGTVLPESGALVAFAQRQADVATLTQIGTDVVLIRNFSDADPQRWQYATSHVAASDQVHSWNNGVLAGEGDGFVYMIGMRENGLKGTNQTQHLARIREDDLLTFHWDGMQFWGGELAGWVVRAWDAAKLYDGPFTEGTLARHPLGFYYVVCLQAGDSNIIIHSAANLTGPWGGAIAYRLPPDLAQYHQFAYAAKAHPELAQAEDELVISYNVNCVGEGFTCLDGNLSIYVPRFVRLKVTRNVTAARAWESAFGRAGATALRSTALPGALATGYRTTGMARGRVHTRRFSFE